MKKLLVATSALVAAAGSAAALDVTLGGNISISADLNLEPGGSGFDKAGWDAALTLKASGESLGWTYGGTLNLGVADEEGTGAAMFGDRDDDDKMDDNEVRSAPKDVYASKASVYMGNDALGKVTFTNGCADWVKPSSNRVEAISNQCLQWTGYKMNGLELRAAMDLEDSDTDPIVGVDGDIMGLEASAEYQMNAGNYDFAVGTDIAGLDIDVDGSWLDDGKDFDWSVTVGTSLNDIGVKIKYAPQGRASVGGAALTATEIGALITALTAPDAVDGDPDEYVLANGTSANPTVHVNDQEGKDITATLTYGDCWTASVGIDPVNEQLAAAEADVGIAADATDATVSASASNVLLTGSDPDGRIRTQTGDVYGVYKWDVGYACDIFDGLNLSAKIGQDEARGVWDLEGTNSVDEEVDALIGGLATSLSGKITAKLTF